MQSDMFPTLSHAERPSTLRRNRIAQGHELYLGARNSGCWTNATDDFGLQSSDEPEIFLDGSASVTSVEGFPIRSIARSILP